MGYTCITTESFFAKVWILISRILTVWPDVLEEIENKAARFETLLSECLLFSDAMAIRNSASSYSQIIMVVHWYVYFQSLLENFRQNTYSKCWIPFLVTKENKFKINALTAGTSRCFFFNFYEFHQIIALASHERSDHFFVENNFEKKI